MTTRRLRDRVSEHRGSITRRTETGEIPNHAVAQHFNLPGHSVADMVVIGIERVIPTGDRKFIEAREHHWINQYRRSNMETTQDTNYGNSIHFLKNAQSLKFSETKICSSMM